MNALQARYPCMLPVADTEVQLRLMTRADQTSVLDFARSLNEHDLLFLRRDIREPKVMAAWVTGIEAEEIVSLLAFSGTDLVGCTAVVRDAHSWSPHVAELRVLVGDGMRQHGLGRVLIQEAFYQAALMGLDKLCAQMTVDQAAAIAVFESMGFKPEALLRDQVRDSRGATHDLVILSRDMRAAEAKLRTYGLVEDDVEH